MERKDQKPRWDENRDIEEAAERAFENIVWESRVFVRQRQDRYDYGTDYQLEVKDQGEVTNVRLHAQLKGTGVEKNADGSVSVSVDRTNLNYLLENPHSFYVCFHAPTGRLLYRAADSVYRQYEHAGRTWVDQKTVTIKFHEILTVDHLRNLAAVANEHSAFERDLRASQSAATLETVAGVIAAAPSSIYVPSDPKEAALLLNQLFTGARDLEISANFDKFASILRDDSDAMAQAYMAEINCVLAHYPENRRRLQAGIDHLQGLLQTGRYVEAHLYYSIGNGYSAVGNEAEALANYETALALFANLADPISRAMCLKNAGTSHERLGDRDKAVEFYNLALVDNPDLAEAHMALGNHYHRVGNYAQALAHFDKVAWTENSLGKPSAVSGWRINVLFNLDRGAEAFREINSLLPEADREPWIWPTCQREVAMFGRSSLENAKSAVTFWKRVLKRFPDSADAKRELMLGELGLRMQGEEIGVTYEAYKAKFDAAIGEVSSDSIALLWDRLGHWAQDNGNWAEAEACFRRAYDLEKGHYGYCLGTSLNHLGRFEEALPLLIEQAESLQPDGPSWLQLGSAYQNLGRYPESIDAYKRSIELEPDYPISWFNLGGAYWNSNRKDQALETWASAIQKFPNHELAQKLRTEFPFAIHS